MSVEYSDGRQIARDGVSPVDDGLQCRGEPEGTIASVYDGDHR